MSNTKFARTGMLLRLNLRRDWLKITLWALGIVGLMAGAAAKFDGLYGTKKAMDAIMATLKTPAMVSLLGPVPSAHAYTVATIYAAEMMVFMGLFVAMMNIYFAVHTTRADEDTGITELVAAHATGRNASLAAAGLEVLVVNLGVGILAALGLQFSGMTGIDSNGNWLFGLGVAAFGLMFAGITFLAAQVAASGRGATILSYVVLGVLFIARMGTDVQNPDLTWWTIYGWIEKLDIYGSNNWWPLLLMLAVAVVTGGIALTLVTTRDLGAGLLPQRDGRRYASRWLRGPLSLVARLDRTSIIIWLVGMFILGVTYGSIFGSAGDLMSSNPTMAKLIGTTAVRAANRTIVLQFANKLAIIFVVLATVPGLITLMRINRDEAKGYWEQLHARSVSRFRLYYSITALAMVVAVLAYLMGILGMYAAGAASMGKDAVALSRFMRAFWGFTPALIVTMGITAAFIGWLPRWQNLAWLVPAYGFFSLYLGSLLDFPDWATALTPYGWVNNVPLHAVEWSTTGMMLALGVTLIIGGFGGYAHRDLLEN